ncbi:hypothetical protein QEH59_08515 [Coraliomargarita sp. SDUM461004]|uniref:DUF3224 domain-containing protein n=1 Tax=Thalassobacterium sedimentorum TaxID=3041258 RepID=A0ABU1AIE5_9BACT|nr:hypothetical protein [Coraliomargarita sp. SDUM461004]MDQ8194467.1 hypothetical protein [Coraliomargarita sp. SDUM461004]
MRKILIACLAVLPFFVSAEPLLISAKVLDRADNGAAIRGLYVYPSVVLESGEQASMHIGPELRFPVGEQQVDLGDGVSKMETIYETIPVGFSFTLSYTLKDGIISYTGKGTSKMSLGIDGQTSETASRAILFYGETELGGLVEAQFTGPDGNVEDFVFHFGPAPDSE